MDVDKDGGPVRRRDPLFRLIWFGLGAINGLVINIVSDDLRWRSVVIGILVVGVTAARLVMRRYVEPRSAIGRMAPTVLLTAALPVAVVARTESPPGPATLAMLALVAVAVLIPGELETTWRLLLGAATVGIGVTGVGVTIFETWRSSTQDNAIAVSFAIVILCFGVAVLRDSGVLAAAALAATCLFSLGAGVTELASGVAIAGLPLFILVACIAAFGVSRLRGNAALGAAAIGIFGFCAVALGLTYLAYGLGLLWSGAICVLGVLLLVLSIALLTASRALMGSATVVFGCLTAGTGIALARNANGFGAAAVTCIGLAMAGLGVIEVRRTALLAHVQTLAKRWSRAPHQPQQALRPKRHPGFTSQRSRPSLLHQSLAASASWPDFPEADRDAATGRSTAAGNHKNDARKTQCTDHRADESSLYGADQSAAES